MRIINDQIQGCYKDSKENLYIKYNNKMHITNDRKELHMGDIFCDLRDECFKIVESQDDLFEMSFIDPKLYHICEEVTVQN